MIEVDAGAGRTLAAEAVGVGPAVVLVHAGIADSRMWDDVVPLLADGHRVIRYDLPGFGLSTLAGQTISSTADLDAVLDAVGEPRAALVGVSLGGRIALEFALARPARVTALLLVAPGLRGHTPSSFVRRAAEAEDEAFERGDYGAAADVMVQTWVAGPRRSLDDVDPAVRELVRTMCIRNYELLAEAVAAGGPPADADVPAPAAAERLGELALPLLVLVGDADVPDMLQIADRLEAGVPGARKVVWEGVAHVPPLERPREFAELVRGFLADARR